MPPQANMQKTIHTETNQLPVSKHPFFNTAPIIKQYDASSSQKKRQKKARRPPKQPGQNATSTFNDPDITADMASSIAAKCLNKQHQKQH
jgi:hypothetical protein